MCPDPLASNSEDAAAGLELSDCDFFSATKQWRSQGGGA